MRKGIVFLFLLVSTCTKVSATHFIGGEITWKCLADGKFQFYMRVYRDCRGIDLAFVNETIEIEGSPLPKDASGINVLSILMKPDSSRWQNENFGTVTPYCDTTGGKRTLDCFWEDDGAVQQFFYTSEPIILRGVPPRRGWNFYWQVPCCRTFPSEIKNVNTGGAYAGQMLLRASMYASSNGQNTYPCYDSSPEFKAAPVSAICRGISSTIDPGVFDEDSVVVSWDRSYNDPIANPDPLPYNTGYTFKKPFDDSTFHPMNRTILDPLSGVTTLAIYSGSGNSKYITVTRADSYREGKLVASVFREIPVTLMDCNNAQQNTAPKVSLGGLEKNDTTIYLKVGEELRLPVKVVDSDSSGVGDQKQGVILTVNGDVLTKDLNASGACDSNQVGTSCAYFTNSSFSLDSIAFQPARYTLHGDSVISTELVWRPSCSSLKGSDGTKTYNFFYQVQDDYCPIPGVRSGTIKVVLSPDTTIGNPSPQIKCIDSQGGTNLVSWELDTPKGFSYWLVYGINNTGISTVLDTLWDSKQRTYTDSGNSNVAYAVELGYSYCDSSILVKEKSKILSNIIHANAEMRPNSIHITWEYLWGDEQVGRNFNLFANFDGSGYVLIDTAIRESFYSIPDTSCFSSASFYIEDECGKHSDTIQVSPPIYTALNAKREGECIRLNWSVSNEHVNSVRKKYIMLGIDGGTYKIVDSLYTESTYCFTDSFCYSNLRFYIRDACGNYSNQTTFNNNGATTFVTQLYTFATCATLLWTPYNHPGLQTADKYYSIYRSYNSIDYEKIDLVRNTDKYCVIAENCGLNAYYKVGFDNCDITSNAVYLAGVHLPIDTGISEVNNVLIANDSTAAYFWYDCNADKLILDEFSRAFAPKDTGVYAVILRKYQCQDTSACIPVFPVGIQERNAFINELTYYPNPTTGKLNIDFKEVQQKMELTVRNIHGQALQQQNFSQKISLVIDLQGAPGIYFIGLRNEAGETANWKVVKQ